MKYRSIDELRAETADYVLADGDAHRFGEACELLRAWLQFEAIEADVTRQAWHNGFFTGIAAAASGLRLSPMAAEVGLTAARAAGRPPRSEDTMKLHLESTTEIVDLVTSTGEVPARVWEGRTESGIAVQCLITRIAVKHTDDTAQFERELQACTPPRHTPRAFDARLIL